MQITKSMKLNGVALLNVILAAACSGEAHEFEELGAIEEPITRGRLINSLGDNPLGLNDASLKWQSAAGTLCSGTKVGPKRILTAQHCVGGMLIGSDIAVTNSFNGVLPAPTRKVTAIHRYPTTQPNRESGHWVDAALIDVDVDLPGASVGIRGSKVGAETGTYIGYGCDAANPSNSGKKQTGKFLTQTFPVPVSDAGYVYSNQANGSVICSGDSGGSLYFKVDGTWVLGGIGATSNATESFFTRTDAIKAWIADPKVNDFRHGSAGAFLNWKGNNCITATNFPSLRYCKGPDSVGESQKFFLQASGAGFMLVLGNGRCLAPAANGQIVEQNLCPADISRWKFVNSMTVGGFKYWRVQNVQTGKCISTAGSVSEATLLQSADCSVANADQQLFTFVKR